MTAPKIFDLITLPKNWEDLPAPDGPYYVAAKQGLYIHKKGPLGVALVPTNKLPPNLNALPESIEKGRFLYQAPKVPAQTIAQTLAFFTAVLEKHEAEAEVLICYNEANTDAQGKWFLFCPYQRVTGGSVHSIYDPTTLPEGFQAIGSIHSHCNMGAFHSGTDTGDAAVFPGLHITIGTLKSTPTFAAMVMFNGVQFDYDIDVVAEIAGRKATDFPNHWLERVITSKEYDRAKVIAETMQNIDEDDRRRFLSGYTPPKVSDWNNPNNAKRQWPTYNYAGDGMWDDYPWWSGAKEPKDKKTRKTHHTANRWAREIGQPLPAELLDTDGDFKGPEQAITGIAHVLERLTAVAAEYGLELGFEIGDAQTGETIIWNFADGDVQEAPTTQGAAK